MAPSAIAVETEVKPQQTYKVNLGAYKDIDNTRVNRDVEEGKTGEVPAKVRRICLLTYLSTADPSSIVPQLPAHLEPRAEILSLD